MTMRTKHDAGASERGPAEGPASPERLATRPIRPARIAAAVASAYGLLLILGLGAAFATHSTHDATIQKAAELFLFEEESNLPTLFNFSLLVANMAALAAVSAFAFGARDRWRWHWGSLAALFLLMAYDEAAQLHEKLSPLLEEHVGEGAGLLGFAWVVPGMAFVALVSSALVPFLLALPQRTAVLFLAAGMVYVAGSLGVEMLEARHAGRQGWDDLTFSLLTVVEESLEMIGLMILLRATTSHLAGLGDGVILTLHRLAPRIAAAPETASAGRGRAFSPRA